jgi:hypothetical protein
MLWTALCPLLLACGLRADEKSPRIPKAPTPSRETDRPADLNASPERIRRLIRQLGSRSFKEREAAERALIDLGRAAEDQVRRAMKDDDPEVARRARAVYLALPVVPEIEYATSKEVAELRQKYPPVEYRHRYTGDEKVQLLNAGKPVGPELTFPSLPKWYRREGACCVASPDGRLWAYAQHYSPDRREDYTDVWVWDVRTGKLVAKMDFGHHVRQMAFSAGGRRLLCYVYDDMRSGR